MNPSRRRRLHHVTSHVSQQRNCQKRVWNKNSMDILKARALHTFRAQTNKELSLNKGDMVYVLRQIDNNWYEGQRHGSVGIFPVSYVEIVEICHQQSRRDGGRGEGVSKMAVALFDFVAQDPAELSFQKGDLLRLMNVVDCNWYEASLNGRTGLVPKDYVEVVREQFYVPLTLPISLPASYTDSSQHDSPGTLSSTSSYLSSGLDHLVVTSSETSRHPCDASKANSSQTEADSGIVQGRSAGRQWPVNNFRVRSNSLGTTRTFSTEPGTNWFDDQNQDFYLQHDWSVMGNAGEAIFPGSQSDEAEAAYSYAPESRFGPKQQIDRSDILPYLLFQAIFPYEPRDEDELQLLPGDMIYVTEIFDDGWYVGISQRTNTYGTFPGNFAQKLHRRHLEPCTL